MDEQIKNICRSCNISLRSPSKIRSCLTEDSATTLTHAFITCKLDNLNSLLTGPYMDTKLNRLQLIQNHAARIITRTKKFDHISGVLKNSTGYQSRRESYYNSSRVCVCVCLFPISSEVLWRIFAKLGGWTSELPLRGSFSKRSTGRWVNVSLSLYYICARLTPHRCKKHTAYDSRRHQAHATPLQKAHGVFCSLDGYIS